jgi:hypothetical protein
MTFCQQIYDWHIYKHSAVTIISFLLSTLITVILSLNSVLNLTLKKENGRLQQTMKKLFLAIGNGTTGLTAR